MNDAQILFAKADNLMFYHIYANLVEPSKSNDFNKISFGTLSWVKNFPRTSWEWSQYFTGKICNCLYIKKTIQSSYPFKVIENAWKTII